MAGTVLDRAKPVVIVAAVALLTAALGVAASAHMARAGQAKGQSPGSTVERQGPGPMGPGGMGRGPGMRGGPGGPGGFGGMMGGPLGMLGPELRAVGLTSEQRTQVQAIVQSHREAQAAIGERLRAANAALREAVTAETFDEGNIRAKAAEVAAAEADAAVLRAKVRAEVFALLTPEQIQKAKELRGRTQDGPRKAPGRARAPRPGTQVQPPAPEAPVSLPEMV